MAIFGKEERLGSEPRGGGGAGESSISIIATGMVVTGDIVTDGVVKIEGRVEGNIRAARQVLIGRQGQVNGDISTREAVIGGTIDGTVTASERVEIQGTSTVSGDIHTRSISVVEGARLTGSVRVNDSVEAPAGQEHALQERLAEVR